MSKQYKIYGRVVIPCWTTIEAESEQEALNIVNARDYPMYQIEDETNWPEWEEVCDE